MMASITLRVADLRGAPCILHVYNCVPLSGSGSDAQLWASVGAFAAVSDPFCVGKANGVPTILCDHPACLSFHDSNPTSNSGREGAAAALLHKQTGNALGNFEHTGWGLLLWPNGGANRAQEMVTICREMGMTSRSKQRCWRTGQPLFSGTTTTSRQNGTP